MTNELSEDLVLNSTCKYHSVYLASPTCCKKTSIVVSCFKMSQSSCSSYTNNLSNDYPLLF